jgi:hypothetical protein
MSESQLLNKSSKSNDVITIGAVINPPPQPKNKNMKSIPSKLATASLALALMAAASPKASAATYYFGSSSGPNGTSSSGSWGDINNWYGPGAWASGIPGASDTAISNNGGPLLVSAPQSANILQVGVSNVASSLDLQSTLTISSGGVAQFGAAGAALGTLTMTTGSPVLTGADYLQFGTNASTNGLLTMSTGSISANYMIVGNAGTGTVNMSGGTIDIDQNLYLGNQAGSSGTFNLSGGTVTVSSLNFNSGTQLLAISGSGKLVINNDGWDVDSWLGTVNTWISQGKITGAEAEIVGNTVEITAAPVTYWFNTASGNWSTATNWAKDPGPGNGVPGAKDTALNNNGTLLVNSPQEASILRVGISNVASSLDLRDTLTIGTYVTIGDVGSASGTLTMTSGSPSLSVANGYLTIAANAGTTGLLNMSTGDISCRNFLVGNEGSGTANISDGSVTVERTVFIENQPTGSGILNLSGGTIYTPSLEFGFSGGTAGTLAVSGTGTMVIDALNGFRRVRVGEGEEETRFGTAANCKAYVDGLISSGRIVGKATIVGDTVEITARPAATFYFGYSSGPNGTSSSGSWGNSNNWYGPGGWASGIPGASDRAISNNGGPLLVSAPQSANILQVGVSNVASSLDLQDTLTISSGGAAQFGAAGAALGTLTMTTGSPVLTGAAYLEFGTNASTNGLLTMSKGSISATNMIVGNAGNGTVNMSGGTIDATVLFLANQLGSSGTFNLSGGTVSVGAMYFNQGNAGQLTLSGSGKLVYRGGDLTTVNTWISQGKITGQAAQVGNNIEITALGYGSWNIANAGGQAANLDYDNDGVFNGVEYFMDSAAGFTANPGLVGNTVTWLNGGNIPSSAYGSQFVVQISTDLTNWTDVPGTGDANLENTSGSVAYTLSGAGKKFVRLKVVPN